MKRFTRGFAGLVYAVVAMPAFAAHYKVIHSFAGAPYDGELPGGPVVVGKGGVLYGTTEFGGNGACNYQGRTGCGAVYSLTPPTSPGEAWTEAVLYNFSGPPNDGGNIPNGLVMDASGVLYGVAVSGGSGRCNFDGALGCGAVFSLTPPASTGGAWTETVLYSFSGVADGAYPNGVIVANNGVLYGTTQNGGTNLCGTAFSLTPPATGGAWSFTVLHEFSTTGPKLPFASLLNSGGVLYGTSYLGGNYSCQGGGCGTVFSLTPPKSKGGPWTEETLYSFEGPFSDGANPSAAVVMGSGGVVYGTTQGGGSGACSATGIGGCGAVFSLSPPTAPGGTWTEALLYSFNTNGRCSNGDTVFAGVTIGSGGVLYGTTDCGGPNYGGAVYSLTPPGSAGAAWTETTVHSFVNSANGSNPYANVVIGHDGTLYGTTYGGGADGGGTVFSVKP